MNEEHVKMPRSQRAKQFAPFDAVVGLRDALKEKERITELRKTISDDLCDENNRILKNLRVGDKVSVSYYCSLKERYIHISGHVNKLLFKKQKLYIENAEISFKDIYIIHSK